MALASVSDYENITGLTVGDDVDRITALLDLASDAVLANAFGQEITESSTTGIVLRAVSGIVRFPQRPVTAVSNVVVRGQALTAGTDYRFTTGGPSLTQGKCRPALLIHRRNGYDVPWSYFGYSDLYPIEITCDYTHGWATVPGQIIAAVCNMVFGVVALDGSPYPASTERVGLISEKRDIADAQTADLAVTGSTRSLLERLCKAPSPESVDARPDIYFAP